MNLFAAKDIISQIPSPSLLLNLQGNILGKSAAWDDLFQEFSATSLFDFQIDYWRNQIDLCFQQKHADFSIDFTTTSTRLHCGMKLVESSEDPFIWISMIATKNGEGGPADVQDDYIISMKMKEMSEMAATIAHEINNPLTIIYARVQGLVEALAADVIIDREDLKMSLDKIRLQSERIFKTVSGMRSFSRDSRKDPFIQVPLRRSLVEALSLVNSRTRDRGIQVEICEFGEDIKVFGRPSELIQVFLNLATNAIDAMSETHYPKIKIDVEEAQQNVLIYFMDSGPGVSVENEGKIFTPFFTTKAVGSGTGVGLSITMRIVKNHNGTLRLDRSRGMSCFIIELPKVVIQQKAS